MDEERKLELMLEEEQQIKDEPMMEWISANKQALLKDFADENEDSFYEFCVKSWEEQDDGS